MVHEIQSKSHCLWLSLIAASNYTEFASITLGLDSSRMDDHTGSRLTADKNAFSHKLCGHFTLFDSLMARVLIRHNWFDLI